MLRDKAEEMRLDPEMPPALLQRSRRRRVGNVVLSGILLLGVTAAGIVGVSRLLEDLPPSRPAVNPPAFVPGEGYGLPIWPVGTTEELDRIQQEVDEGHQPWRRDDPRTVGQIFAVDVMGWDIDDVEASVRGDDPITVTISNPAFLEESGMEADVRTLLIMERWRGRDNGILVVTEASSDSITLDRPARGQSVSPNGVVRFSGFVDSVPNGGGWIGSLHSGTVVKPDRGRLGVSSSGRPEELQTISISNSVHGAQDARFVTLRLVDKRERTLALVAFPLSAPTHWNAIWPQTTRQEGEAAQHCADTGDAECTWQLQAREVVLRYATAEFLWHDVVFEVEPESLESSGPHTFQVSGCVGQPWQQACAESGTVTLERSLRPTRSGIFFVIPDGTGKYPAAEALPTEVTETRRAIMKAAVAYDWDAIQRLIPETGFTFSFGGETDPIDYWQGFEGEGTTVLDILNVLLRLEDHGDLRGTFMWPAASAKDPAEWTDSDVEDLRTFYSQRQIEQFQEYGTYVGWRVGIEEDGTWIFFVQGD